jgi:hypothetical protein
MEGPSDYAGRGRRRRWTLALASSGGIPPDRQANHAPMICGFARNSLAGGTARTADDRSKERSTCRRRIREGSAFMIGTYGCTTVDVTGQRV